MVIDRSLAELYSGWFQCLGDATRIQILNLLASNAEAMAVHEIVDALEVGQPTVSHHLKHLERARFVLSERRGASTFVRINQRCIDAFPSAAHFVIGGVGRTQLPWDEAA